MNKVPVRGTLIHVSIEKTLGIGVDSVPLTYPPPAKSIAPSPGSGSSPATSRVTEPVTVPLAELASR